MDSSGFKATLDENSNDNNRYKYTEEDVLRDLGLLDAEESENQQQRRPSPQGSFAGNIMPSALPLGRKASTAGVTGDALGLYQHQPDPSGYFGASELSQHHPSTFPPPFLPTTAPAMAYSPPVQLPAPSLAPTVVYNHLSSSPEPTEPVPPPAPSNRPHRRLYQACQSCRERKVKCDLGSVDAPRDPPCKRCLRERLKCEFAATRKKDKADRDKDKDKDDSRPLKKWRKRDASNDADSSVMSDGLPNYGLTQGNGSQSTSPSGATNGFTRPTWGSRPSVTSQPRDDSLRNRNMSLFQPSTSQKNPSGVHLHSQVAAATLGAPVASTQDSILLLVDAANAFNESTTTPHDQGSPLSERGTAGRKRAFSSLGHGGPDAPSDVGFSPQEQAEQQAGLKAWSQMRFVRNGWFTAWEAMQYVEYFYDRLAPMTPVVFPDFRSPYKHQALLVEEPILALAILAIASRHLRLSGHAAGSRSYAIHENLWNSLRRQVERLLWGQEQFGGGFCGGGSTAKIRESNSGQITWKGSLRTLGTIEALLILTDWQPRALHFPPNGEDHGLLDQSLTMSSDMNHNVSAPDDQPTGRTRDYENLPYASWLEPAWRSDRMSWMLLGLAQNLAFELGVFDNNHFHCRHQHGPDSECARKRRIRNLLLVYVAQTSGRMGIQSSLNVEDWETDTTWDETSKTQRQGRGEHPLDIMQACWVHIARLMNRANREVFPSHQFTRELTTSGRYKDSIATFALLLQNWKTVFEQSKPYIHPVMQSILTMEYEYARLYINSLGLQNVVESWVEGGSTIRKATLAKIAEDNKPYIDEVTDAALNILGTVVDGMASKGYLRDAPVRTYLRSLSGMMFTLKRFSLGTHESLVRRCLQQLETVTSAMSKEVVDDVHLSSSTSRLVQNIVRNVTQTLIRVQQPGTGSAGPSREQSRPQSPHGHNEPATENQQPPVQAMNLTPLSPEHHDIRDPLAGIQARPMAELESQVFVPPPNFNGDGQDLDPTLPDDANLDPAMGNFSMDWFALPLDNLFHNDEATVDQGFGGIGPTVGARDMLELITNRDYNQMQWNGSQSFGMDT
ncbi:uncharacterized protein Z518_03437 [Rhinocladiella mackenziei CBS 650.93]|uniref:Zn(2)-C6 fungal-type domain-containing protein n=1 Tax=Rhinocladiella mackenziei CBS 650.93 TaxID=1442369 RepID=A0A0D2JHE9_9EURO|nr:uncharacterized protein Z518_03437 [Rhinocladiella mackenziei CBS 650.93]KIX08780.1 hypothetical protein Z518_03437 [Rhinocladiella mackenziei CBS 650.93]